MTTASNDIYVGETQESSDDWSPGDWAYGRAHFYSRDYASRDDITSAIIEYNEKVGRTFRVISSDHRRYKVLCVDPNCSFAVAFAYGRGFEPPHTFVPHTCNATMVDLASYEASRGNKSSYVALIDSVLQSSLIRVVTPVQLRYRRSWPLMGVDWRTRLVLTPAFDSKRNSSMEIARSTTSSCHAYTKWTSAATRQISRCVRTECFGESSYTNPAFICFREFADRGINLDGTFIDNKYAGVLLVACCKNSNNEIQIVAVAWVSGETKDN